MQISTLAGPRVRALVGVCDTGTSLDLWTRLPQSSDYDRGCGSLCTTRILPKNLKSQQPSSETTVLVFNGRLFLIGAPAAVYADKLLVAATKLCRYEG